MDGLSASVNLPLHHKVQKSSSGTRLTRVVTEKGPQNGCMCVINRILCSVGRSVTVVSPAKTAAPIEMPCGLRTRVGPRNHVLDGGPDPPMGRGNFDGGEGRPIVKYRDTLLSPAQKWLNRSRCRVGCGLGWAIGIMC